jgi:hypothetical protein
MKRTPLERRHFLSYGGKPCSTSFLPPFTPSAVPERSPSPTGGVGRVRMITAAKTYGALLGLAVLLLAPLSCSAGLSPAATPALQCAHTVYYESCVPGLSQMVQCTRSPLKGPCDKAYCPQHCSGKGVCRGAGDSTSCDCNSGFAGHFCTLKICPKVCTLAALAAFSILIFLCCPGLLGTWPVRNAVGKMPLRSRFL